MSFKIQSQLSEDQIESDVASYLGYITPIWKKRLRLISVDESTTGADKLFKRFVPIYLQFKVSQGLDPKASIVGKLLNKPLARIISYRKSNALAGDPVLYFQLRKMAKTASDFQHNLLMNMHRPPYQYGLYIAPLTLDLNEYEKLLDSEPRWWSYWRHPFSNEESHLTDSIQNLKLFLGSNPFLRHHIAIPPHKKTNTHIHHYSFSKNGADVAWHGGELIEADYRLSKVFSEICAAFYSDKQNSYSLNRFLDNLNELDMEGMPKFDKENRYNEIAQLNYVTEFSKYLKNVFNIKLIFLVADKEE